MGHPPRRPGGPLSPRVEALEARWMPAVIGGYVHQDCNANGLFESSLIGTATANGVSEVGLGGSTLQLYDSTGQLVATTVSDATGRYEFTRRDNLPNTTEVVVQELDFSLARTDAERVALLQQFDPTLGELQYVRIFAEASVYSQVQLENLEAVAAEVATEINGSLRYEMPGLPGLAAQVQAEVGDTLGAFDGQGDLAGTSGRDFGVKELKGSFQVAAVTNPADLAAYIGTGSVAVKQSAEVTSCSCGTGNLLAMVRSMTAGKVRVVYRYRPSDELGPGQYTVVQVGGVPGHNDGLETSDNVTAIPGSDRTDRITVNVVSRTDVLRNNHFGEMEQSSVTGGVYHDADLSGSWNAGDPGLAGVTIHLTGTDIFGQAVSLTTQTDGAGLYAFRGLTRGNYTLTEIQPAGYLQGTNNLGSLGGTISGDSFVIGIGCGEDGQDYNFGEVTPPPPPPPLTVPEPPPSDPPLPPAPPPTGATPQPILSKFFLLGQSWLDMV